MLHIWLCIVVLLLEINGGVHGYMIDSDCGDDTQYVQDRVDTAFRLMATTVTELNKNPINQDVDNLHNRLFGLPFDQTKPNNIKRHFEALGTISQRNDNDQTVLGGAGARTIDVKFYCSVKRIEKRRNGDKTEYVNKDRNIVYKEGELTSPGGSFANCFDILEPTMMLTLTVPDQYSEIQICPWYLRKARGFRFRDLTDIPSAAMQGLGKLAIPALGKAFYTPIDMFVLTDKMIVHELTHTDQAVFPTQDMAPKAYGWKNARNLVQIYTDGNYEARLDPVGNADSNALFAVGTWLLVQDAAKPINIGDDGSFTKPQATPKVKL